MAFKTYRDTETNKKVTAKCFDPPVEVGGTIEGCQTAEDAEGIYLDWYGTKCYLEPGRENWFGHDEDLKPTVWTHTDFQNYKPAKF